MVKCSSDVYLQSLCLCFGQKNSTETRDSKVPRRVFYASFLLAFGSFIFYANYDDLFSLYVPYNLFSM